MPTEFWIFNFGLSTLIGAGVGVYFGLVKKWPQHPGYVIFTLVLLWLSDWVGLDSSGGACMFCTTVDGHLVGIGLKALVQGFLITVSLFYLLWPLHRRESPTPVP